MRSHVSMNRNTKVIDMSNVVPNIITITSDYGEATRTLYTLFAHDPSLFGARAQSLMYALYAGVNTKVDSVRSMIASIATNRSITVDETNPYINEGSLLAIWARLMKNSKEIIVFEPVMGLLNNALKTYMSKKTVVYNGKEYPLEFFKPLCYDRNGRNYYDILPYIGYIATFFIRGRQYSFSDSFSNANANAFKNELEKYYMASFAGLKRDHGINIFADDLSVFSTTGENALKNMIDAILDPAVIMRIRDTVLKTEKGAYEEAVNEQSRVTQEEITSAFRATMDTIISIVVDFNPVKEMITKVPPFKPNPDSLELANLTAYALAGGNSQFCVNDNDRYTYEYAFGESIPTFDFFERQNLSTDIRPLKASVKMPFTSADPYLNIVAAYVKAKFDTIHSDPLGGATILDINVSDNELKTNYNNYSKLLMALIAQGTWLSYSESMHGIMQIVKLNETLDDINKLSSVINEVYGNPIAATVLPAYITTRIPHYILMHIRANQSLRTFRIFEYIHAYDVSAFLMVKLYNALIALMYLKNDNYCKFVNAVAGEIGVVLERSVVLMPYVKGLKDAADAYAIGGIDLYRFAVSPNPFVRAFAIVRNIMGTNEAMNYYCSVISSIVNPSAFEVIEDGVYDPVIKPSLEKIEKREPVLMDFIFKDGGYIRRDVSDILMMTIGSKKITEVLAKYIYKGSNADAITNNEVLSRRLNISGSSVTVDKISHDDIDFGSQIAANVPVYDMSGEIRTLQFTLADYLMKKRLVEIEMFSPSLEKNMMVWVFTDGPMNDRFSIKAEMTA